MTQNAPTASPSALTDIVERLRAVSVPPGTAHKTIFDEAADEIERLRAALLHIAEQAESADEAEIIARAALELEP